MFTRAASGSELVAWLAVSWPPKKGEKKYLHPFHEHDDTLVLDILSLWPAQHIGMRMMTLISTFAHAFLRLEFMAWNKRYHTSVGQA